VSNYVIRRYCDFSKFVVFIMSVTLGYLYLHIIYDEKMCVQFLQDGELLPTLNENNNRCT
jgi:hypothetical protein